MKTEADVPFVKVRHNQTMDLSKEVNQMHPLLIRMHKRPGRKLLDFLLMLTGFVLLSGSIAVAEQKPPGLALTNTVAKEVKTQKNGQWVVETILVDKAVPGDVLVYTVNYENTGKAAAVNAAIVDPIPAGVVYLSNTVEGKDADITYSVDGSRTWQSPPVMIELKKSDGTKERKPALPEQYTHIRWVIKKPVQPGQSGQVHFKVTVK